LLKENGFAAEAVVGEAAWRYGPGDNDTIGHGPEFGGARPGARFMGHAWVMLHGDDAALIVDPTLSELPEKARQADTFFGEVSRVDWAPAVLITADFTIAGSIAEAVVQAPEAGVYVYRRQPELEPILARLSPTPGMVTAAREIMRELDLPSRFRALPRTGDDPYVKHYRIGDHDLTLSWGRDTAPVETWSRRFQRSNGARSKPPRDGSR
jgi:hypothetical protein